MYNGILEWMKIILKGWIHYCNYNMLENYYKNIGYFKQSYIM